MTTYEDDAILLDDTGILVKNYCYPGHPRRIPFASIVSYATLETGALTGRFRLVGFGFRRPRHFFHWDRGRSEKRFSIALDIGKRIRPVISPDDHSRVLELLGQRVGGRKLGV